VWCSLRSKPCFDCGMKREIPSTSCGYSNPSAHVAKGTSLPSCSARRGRQGKVSFCREPRETMAWDGCELSQTRCARVSSGTTSSSATPQGVPLSRLGVTRRRKQMRAGRLETRPCFEPGRWPLSERPHAAVGWRDSMRTVLVRAADDDDDAAAAGAAGVAGAAGAS